MKYYSDNVIKDLPNGIREILDFFRSTRKFDVDLYIKSKIVVLNTYMKEHGLDTCLVAVSGGIDSAVVLSLVDKASKQTNSPIRKIQPILLPALKNNGATNQDGATKRGLELCSQLNLKGIVLDISDAQNTIKNLVDKNFNLNGNAWASGQLVSYARTPILYYINSLLIEQGFKPILVGTTNRDEGAYLGYVGKASDGMVDVQLISDLHKSEVYEIARFLNVPNSIIQAVPSGDMFDGRVDEEVFGASYDFVELYLNFKNLPKTLQNGLLSSLSDDEKEKFNLFAKNIENLHKFNLHKYLGKSPAVHLDVYDSAVFGGWEKFENYYSYFEQPSRNTTFINPYNMSNNIIEKLGMINLLDEKGKQEVKNLIGFENASVIKNLLSKEEVSIIKNDIEKQNWIPVGIDGYLKNYNPNDSIGSWRLSTYSEDLAKIIWERLKINFKQVQWFDNERQTDWDGVNTWRAIGINPLFRFIKYKDNGVLIPHYDGGFQYNPSCQTLMTLVIYLTNNKTGKTRFIEDKQKLLFEKLNNNYFENKKNINYNDWIRFAEDSEVICGVNPDEGSCLIFDHHLLHDCEKVSNEEKIIIRTDIIFEKNGIHKK